MYWFGSLLGSAVNPTAVVRQNLVEDPELTDAFSTYDAGNLVRAFWMFEDATTLGNAAAQYNLGVCYETATGVAARSDRAAEEWYRKAAEQGLSEAQFSIAAVLAGDIMAGHDRHSTDEQGERLVEAYMWLLQARSSGFAQADDSIRRLSAHMTTLQIEQATALATSKSTS